MNEGQVRGKVCFWGHPDVHQNLSWRDGFGFPEGFSVHSQWVQASADRQSQTSAKVWQKEVNVHLCVWEGKLSSKYFFPGFKLMKQKQNQLKHICPSRFTKSSKSLITFFLVQRKQTQRSVDWSTNRWHSIKQIKKITLFMQMMGLSLLHITTTEGWARKLHYKCTYG